MFLRKAVASLAICALASTVNSASNSTAFDSNTPCDVSAIELLAPQTTILNITAKRIDNYPVPQGPYYDVFVPLSSAPSNVSFCNVTVTYTHPGWDDTIQVFVGLPLQGWNRKFLALGGSGFSTNAPLDILPVMASFGYASAATDGGHLWQDISWALKGNSSLVNYPLLVDMASESLKDMTVLGRQLAELHYGEPAERAYWVGCSQGGRQGMMAAQRYAHLYDGILANAPAIRWNDLLVGMQWQSVTMYETGTAPPPCVLDAFTNAAIAACDGLDGLEDGVISLPGSCSFDPYSLVGESVNCGGGGGADKIKVTGKDAFVIQQVLSGPPTTPGGNSSLFVGYSVGTNLSTAVSTSCADNNRNCTANGVIFANEWIPKFLAKNYAFNPLTITYDQFYRFFAQAKREYDWVIGTADADLRHLRLSDTKLLSFHGFADELIPPANTVRYYREALALDANLTDYYRLFMAPGVMHCGGGQGPNPTAMLHVLERWVENGTAPTRLDAVATAANGTRGERQVCMYPESSRYTGGDPTLASSFTCS
ncbi:Tannase/feruloyl esterase [Cordyceps fumosorosea ARSEF 2679]|uniref:Carboxylic ester hydrolase n=1 Tax=Cordyceps fumosorosea (strain ARSEF 2679) TaxID=1081104 RepID=A0A162MXX3_CORFA|nr:Tannase/feruloyl esterase [Cordyceps fumosorosea ARSEF 2679]OAA72389.1 Tannase/feruloyl esterase [Cordyceps fumosorosea ARSEF 2679]